MTDPTPTSEIGRRTIAPIQLLILAFPGNHFTGQILPELARLREHGLVRLVGLVFVRKDAFGVITSLQETDLRPEAAAVLGDAARQALGLRTNLRVVDPLHELSVFGYSDADIRQIARDIPIATSVAIAVFEHLWALALKEAVVDARGRVIADGLIGPSALVALDEEFRIFDDLPHPAA